MRLVPGSIRPLRAQSKSVTEMLKEMLRETGEVAPQLRPRVMPKLMRMGMRMLTQRWLVPWTARASHLRLTSSLVRSPTRPLPRLVHSLLPGPLLLTRSRCCRRTGEGRQRQPRSATPCSLWSLRPPCRFDTHPRIMPGEGRRAARSSSHVPFRDPMRPPIYDGGPNSGWQRKRDSSGTARDEKETR